MKEDINKLEIKILETKGSAFPTYWTKEDATLVEKLIARYKELEKQRDSLMWQRNTIDIPKIEELQAQIDHYKELFNNVKNIIEK